MGGMCWTDAQVEVLREELYRVIDSKDRDDVSQPVLLRNLGGNDSAPVWQIVNIWEASEAFRNLMYSEKDCGGDGAVDRGDGVAYLARSDSVTSPLRLGGRPVGIRTRRCGRLFDR